MNNQSDTIAFALFLAFVIFITMRGHLPLYIALLVGNAKSTNGNAVGGQGKKVKATILSMSGD